MPPPVGCDFDRLVHLYVLDAERRGTSLNHGIRIVRRSIREIREVSFRYNPRSCPILRRYRVAFAKLRNVVPRNQKDVAFHLRRIDLLTPSRTGRAPPST